jgi:hypothetical protein
MNKEVKKICLKCEYNIHCQGKGCAFRSLSNDYCDEVENANNLIKNLQQKINQLETNRDEAIEYIKRHDQHNGDNYYNLDKDMWDREIDILSILERGKE